jgi:hypothetical protein
MSIEAAIAHVLGASASVAALVGTRVYWGDRLQGEDVPALVYRCGESAPYTTRTMLATEVELVGIADAAADAIAVAMAAYGVLAAQAVETNIGTTGKKFVAVSAALPTLLEPETGEAEARAECLALVVFTLYYR